MENKYEMLTTHKNELVKQYLTYDGFNRMEYVYTAPLNAPHGAPCLVTRYAYDGGSVRIQKMKEYPGTWDSSYEI